MNDATFWLLSTLFWTMVMSFYSMQEMACISCNRLRLEFDVAQKKRPAILLNALLEKPSVLFSTTLIGVNVALMLSSESSRRLFHSWGLDPDLAPLAEIPFVLIFGELVPMFAARLYPDHASRLGARLLYASSVLLAPLNALVDAFFRTIGGKNHKEHTPFLSREELQKLLQERHAFQDEPFHVMFGTAFTMMHKKAYELMRSLDQFPSISAHTSVAELRKITAKAPNSSFCVYHRKKQKIVGMLYLGKLLNSSDSKKVSDFTEPACFVTVEMNALQLLERLQEEEVNEAVVLSDKGEALGIVVLDDLLDELFGEQSKEVVPLTYLEKTVAADTKIEDFNNTHGTKIDPQECKTFAELIEKRLGRHPNPQDSIVIEPLELIVKETTLFKAKIILIKTKAT